MQMTLALEYRALCKGVAEALQTSAHIGTTFMLITT